MSYDPTPADDDDCSPEQLFEILSHPRRRCILRYVQRAEGTVSLAELAAHVSAWEAETEVDRVSHDDVATRLHHVHLPKLSDTEMISYQREHRAVALEKGAGEAEPFLELLATDEKR